MCNLIEENWTLMTELLGNVPQKFKDKVTRTLYISDD